MNTRKFHYPDCNSVKQMKDKNKEVVEKTRDEVISMGYDPCGNCHP
jgi:DNA-entry nuclease